MIEVLHESEDKRIWANQPYWCDERFGPWVVIDQYGNKLSEPYRRWACRRDRGHEGNHDCPAAPGRTHVRKRPEPEAR